MNQIAQESKSFSDPAEADLPEEKDTKDKKDKKKSKKKKKKARKDMTPEEIEIDDKKRKLKEIYDCLMFSQCYTQYSKYGSYIPLEQIG